MKRLFVIIISLLSVLLLTSCSDSTITCKKGSNELIYEIKDDKIIKHIDNGKEATKSELEEMNKNIIEEYYTIENFVEMTKNFIEYQGYTCQ